MRSPARATCGSRRSAASCAARGSTSCRSCGTCCGGEMSLVGPRPELEEFVDLHADDYREILAVPPGITGPTQLRYAGVEARLLGLQDDPEGYYREHLLPDKVALDLDYAKVRSLQQDVKLLCQTLACRVRLAAAAAPGAAAALGRLRRRCDGRGRGPTAVRDRPGVAALVADGALRMTARRSVRVGVVGFGYWGVEPGPQPRPESQGCELGWCCDADRRAARACAAAFPDLRISGDLEMLLADPSLDAVAIATPVATHAPLAELAIGAGKHCFVEKPLAQTTRSAERVATVAAENGLVLMVGHLLEYHPALVALERLVKEGELGEIHYLHSRRLNLGKLRADENALWSLGAHDVSAILRLTGEPPARGQRPRRELRSQRRRGRRLRPPPIPLGSMRPHPPLLARSPQGAPPDRRRFAADGDLRRHGGARASSPSSTRASTPAATSPMTTSSALAPRARLPFGGEEPLRLELKHFVECVARRPPPTLGRQQRRPRRRRAGGTAALARGRRRAGQPRSHKALRVSAAPGGLRSRTGPVAWRGGGDRRRRQARRPRRDPRRRADRSRGRWIGDHAQIRDAGRDRS